VQAIQASTKHGHQDDFSGANKSAGEQAGSGSIEDRAGWGLPLHLSSAPR
jgi:hypothetical protein